MRIISWNSKGLGNPSRNSSVKKVFRKYKADVIMLQETKKQLINKKSFSLSRAVRIVSGCSHQPVARQC